MFVEFVKEERQKRGAIRKDEERWREARKVETRDPSSTFGFPQCPAHTGLPVDMWEKKSKATLGCLAP